MVLIYFYFLLKKYIVLWFLYLLGYLVFGATIGSVMLILFKSRCKKIKLCCGAVECVREPPPVEEDPEDPPDVPDH